MDNKELELKVKDILKEENFFDMIIKTKQFEKEYKLTDFYKETKMDLMSVIKEAKVFYLIKLDSLFTSIQKKINELDTTNLQELMDKISNTFENENKETLDIIQNFRQVIE